MPVAAHFDESCDIADKWIRHERLDLIRHKWCVLSRNGGVLHCADLQRSVAEVAMFRHESWNLSLVGLDTVAVIHNCPTGIAQREAKVNTPKKYFLRVRFPALRYVAC